MFLTKLPPPHPNTSLPRPFLPKPEFESPCHKHLHTAALAGLAVFGLCAIWSM